MPIRFTLIRHGQTAWNVDGRWQGHANVPLNEEGHEQAAHLAAHFVGTDASIIYSSDLMRARQTAQAIADQIHVPVIPDIRLREIDLGEWQGMTGAEAEAWHSELLATVRAGGFTMPRPSGESQQDVAERALAALSDILKTRSDEHILIVTHGGTIRCLLHILQLLDQSHKFIENTSRSVILYHTLESRWQLESYNLLDHLPEVFLSGPGEVNA